MIKISRINGKEYFVNPDLIEFIEETPDTVLTLTTEKKVVVRESAAEIIRRIVEYKHVIFNKLPVVINSGESGK